MHDSPRFDAIISANIPRCAVFPRLHQLTRRLVLLPLRPLAPPHLLSQDTARAMDRPVRAATQTVDVQCCGCLRTIPKDRLGGQIFLDWADVTSNVARPDALVYCCRECVPIVHGHSRADTATCRDCSAVYYRKSAMDAMDAPRGCLSLGKCDCDAVMKRHFDYERKFTEL